VNGSYVMTERVGDVWHWHNSRGESGTAITQKFKRGSETVRNVLVGMGLEYVGKTWRMREDAQR